MLTTTNGDEMSEPYQKTVRVQMTRIKEGSNILYSNSEKIDILMEKSGYLVFELYDGDNLTGAEQKFIDAGFNVQLKGTDLVMTN